MGQPHSLHSIPFLDHVKWIVAPDDRGPWAPYVAARHDRAINSATEAPVSADYAQHEDKLS